MDTTKFQEGKVYQSRSICDHNCVFTATVIKRTPKTATVNTAIYGTSRVKIHADENGVEYMYAMGRYSMAPRFTADRAAC